VADGNSSAITGNGASFLVGRASYSFGFQGPCISTDTACSSSLVALHMAQQGLLLGETAAAAAGGVNIMLTSQTTARICLLQALSPVGRCQSFDAAGDGYGRGEAFTVAYLR
jgi:acyl transferase domain-containing protein